MNRCLIFIRGIVNTLLGVLVMVAVGGCGVSSQPPPKMGVENWRVNGVGGPLELRSLPPANDVVTEWNEWIDSETVVKARVYKVELSGSSNQENFKVEVRRSNTPLGWADWTFAFFSYTDPSNGTYEFVWRRLGRHNADFLKLGDKSVEVWVTPLNDVVTNTLLLLIEAFEGLEPTSPGVFAEPGRRAE